MNTLTEINPTEMATVSAAISWTGLQPGYALNADNAALLLSYCGGLASAAVWVMCDVGLWKRNQLRRRYTVGSDAYNDAVVSLYRELSEYMPLSDTTWRAYINVADRVPYESRVEGAGPSVYLPALTLSPEAWESYLLAVQEGEHKAFLAQLYGQRATQIASTPSPNGYSPHADTDDDVPYSASGPGVVAEAPEWVEEYENNSDSDLPVLSWETLNEIQSLVVAVLLERWGEATEIAGKVEPKIDAFYAKKYFS